MLRKSTLLCIVTLTLFQYETLLSVFGYKLFNRDVPNEDSFLTSVVGVSLDECISACAVRTSCNSVTYRRTAGYCRMYSTTHNDTASSTGVVYSQRAWWKQVLGFPPQFCNASCPESQNCGHVGGVACHITDCLNPSTVDNSDTFGNLRNIGAQVHYVCIDGSEANNGSSVSTCQPDGQWEPIVLVCNMDGFFPRQVGYYTTMSDLVMGLYGPAVYDKTSRGECMSHCQNETRYCTAFSYFPDNGTCILSNTAKSLVEAAGWEVIAKLFPSSYHMGPNGRYTLSYQDAVVYCISLGTTIASSADVEIAYSMGYNVGQCGWVKEGYALVVLHYVIPNIFEYVGVNKCRWGNKWGVFCVNQLYYK